MAYADIGDIASGAVISETYLDQIRANFLAGVPDIFTAAGDIAYATAADAAARLALGAADSIYVCGATAPETQIVPAVRVYNDAAIDPAVANWVTLTFNSERFDTDGMHSTVTNTGRLTVPTNGDGLYMIGGNIKIGVGSGDKGLRILLNGATAIAESYGNKTSDSGDSIAITTLYSLAATDYVELQVYVESDLNVTVSANVSPEFWAIWQRRP